MESNINLQEQKDKILGYMNRNYWADSWFERTMDLLEKNLFFDERDVQRDLKYKLTCYTLALIWDEFITNGWGEYTETDFDELQTILNLDIDEDLLSEQVHTIRIKIWNVYRQMFDFEFEMIDIFFDQYEELLDIRERMKELDESESFELDEWDKDVLNDFERFESIVKNENSSSWIANCFNY